jgi:hypothetical protein
MNVTIEAAISDAVQLYYQGCNIDRLVLGTAVIHQLTMSEALEVHDAISSLEAYHAADIDIQRSLREAEINESYR